LIDAPGARAHASSRTTPPGSAIPDASEAAARGLDENLEFVDEAHSVVRSQRPLLERFIAKWAEMVLAKRRATATRKRLMQ
jgi:hypothetical protein